MTHKMDWGALVAIAEFAQNTRTTSEIDIKFQQITIVNKALQFKQISREFSQP